MLMRFIYSTRRFSSKFICTQTTGCEPKPFSNGEFLKGISSYFCVQWLQFTTCAYDFSLSISHSFSLFFSLSRWTEIRRTQSAITFSKLFVNVDICYRNGKKRRKSFIVVIWNNFVGSDMSKIANINFISVHLHNYNKKKTELFRL